jgi:hypothetical protein
MTRRFIPPLMPGFFLLLLALVSLPVWAARLEADRTEMAVGEISTVHLKGAPFIAVVDWKVGPELEIVDSDSKRARVRAKREGTGTVNCDMNMKTYTMSITVRGGPVQAPAATPAYLPPPAHASPPAVLPAPVMGQAIQPAAARQDGLGGTWRIDAAGYPGKLELSTTQGMLIGRLWLDAHATWEALEDVYFDEAIGELSFTRPAASQSYRGRLQGDSLQGTFSQWSGRDYTAQPASYSWSASRSGPSAAPATAPVAAPFADHGAWVPVETTPGMYRLEQGSGQVKVARQGNNPGGLQHAGLRLNRGLPATGDFDAEVGFSDARIEGGLNQIELQASFADGSVFFVVRDREGAGSHIWAPGLQGNQPCGRAGTLRIARRGETVTGYCDGRAIWSAPRKSPLNRLQFVLQNNGTNDPISVGFRDYRFTADAAPVAGGLAGPWTINANGYTGKLELGEAGGRLTGRVWFDAHGVWEDLHELSFDGRTLRFLRPGPSQRYTGTLSGNEVRGTFDQGGGGGWNWVITRAAGASYTPIPPADGGGKPAAAKLVLEDDKGPYQWIEGTEVQTRTIHAGRAAFRSTGNNHFTHRLGIVGNDAGQYRHIDFWIYLTSPSADIQLQAQVDGTWGKRWGFDGDSGYNGYSWAMEGTTAGLPSGRWLHQRLDLMGQLHIDAGQAITGLAFSSDGGDVYYDSVYLLPAESPTPPPQGALSGKRVLEDDAGPYNWIEKTAVQKEVVAHGQAAFRSTGNNHFTAELGVAGDYPEQFGSLSLWVFPIGAEADLQLQVQVDGAWGKRWGYDAGPTYNGYSWPMEGTTTRLKPGQWQELTVDLLRDLHINPGQKITGLAFSSDNADVYYDSVYLRPNPNPARKPDFQPAGKPVLEDGAESYNWIERSEVESYLVFHGAKAFRSTGNNHFLADLGTAGSGGGQFRHLNFWAFFMGPEADLQVQVQVNGGWGMRWGLDAGPVYNGYSWAMEGTSTRMPSGRWVQVQLDLIRQLHLKPGDRITGLAFSSDNGDVIYDSVYLLPEGVTPVVGAGVAGGVIGGQDYGAASGAAATLGLDKTRFAPGEAVVVRFTAPGGWPGDAWVGIIPASIPHGSEPVNDQHDITYQYLNKRTAGSLTFRAPDTPGNWDFRLHDTDGGGKEFASVSFTVGAAQPVAAGGCVNLARGRPASQSSTSQWSKANDAQGAVDGVIDGGFGFHTENQPNPWWQVDLGTSQPLAEARLYNRMDCCGDRARTVQAMLSDDGRAWRTVYRHKGGNFGGKDGKPLVAPLNGESGRYLRLQLNETTWFHLDEVEVCGAGAMDVSPGGRDYTSRAYAPGETSAPGGGDSLQDSLNQLKGLFKR